MPDPNARFVSLTRPLWPVWAAAGAMLLLAQLVDQVFAWFVPLLIPMIFWDWARRATCVRHILREGMHSPPSGHSAVQQLTINYRKDMR